MIFITLGSQKFQFNRLLKHVDELVQKGIITVPVYAQIGYSDYTPKNYQYKRFLNRDEFSELMLDSELIITHGGTGAIVGALKQHKKVIAIPRLKKYGEHIDDHQLQITDLFSKLQYIDTVIEMNELDNKIALIYQKQFKQYKSQTQAILTSIDNFISQI